MLDDEKDIAEGDCEVASIMELMLIVVEEEMSLGECGATSVLRSTIRFHLSS